MSNLDQHFTFFNSTLNYSVLYYLQIYLEEIIFTDHSIKSVTNFNKFEGLT